jgi:Alpha galactosidase C-terminal beta sandwich domain
MQEKDVLWLEIPGLSNVNYEVMDVWTGTDLGCLPGYSTNVSSHDTVTIFVGAACNGMSLRVH